MRSEGWNILSDPTRYGGVAKYGAGNESNPSHSRHPQNKKDVLANILLF